MNRDHSVIFEIVPKYCISDSFVDCDGYSISSKGLLPTVVDIMVISVKFTHSRSLGAQYATGDQWTNNSRQNEGMEPKQKQYPAVDV